MISKNNNYIYNIVIITFFFIFPMLEKIILQIDINILLYLKLFLGNFILFLLFTIWCKMKERVKYLFLLDKMKENENEKIQKKIFFNFEYEMENRINNIIEREKKWKEKVLEIENKKYTKRTIIDFQLKSTVKELEKTNDILLYKEKILEKFIRLIETIEQKKTSYNMFFEDLIYYFEIFFNVKDIIVIKQEEKGFEIFNKLSNETIFEEEKISKLIKLTKHEYYQQEINREVEYEIILNLATSDNKHGYILVNDFSGKRLNSPIFIKLLRTISIELSNVAENLLYLEKIRKRELQIKEEKIKLENELQESQKNSEIQLEEMSNLYEEIVILYQAGKNLGKILNKNKVEKIALEMILEIIEVEFGLIFYYPNNKNANPRISKLIFSERDKKIDKILMKNLIKESNVYQQLEKTGKEFIINDLNMIKTQLNLKQEISNILVTPIYIGKELIGGVVLFNKENDFTAGNKNLVVALTNQLASSIQNIDFLRKEIENKKEEEQLKIANEIQKGLFPQEMPKLNNFEFFGVNDPAKAVGGDYYDLIKIDENTVIGVIADVSGKGIPAALLVSMFRTVFRMLVQHMKELNPDKILYFMNNILSEESLSGRFVTGIIFKVDSKEGTIEFANAGHDPLLLYKSDDEKIIEYDLDGTIIGFMGDEVFESKKIEIKKDDIIVLYTDGVIEARSKTGEFFEYERLKDIILETSKYPADYIGRKIHREVNKFVADEKNKNDDVTIVTIKGV